MAPVKAQNYITLMKGTENEKSFYLENPSQPTESDILKIKKAYGIKPDTTLDRTRELLTEIEAGKIDTPMSINPNIPEGSPEFYAEAFGNLWWIPFVSRYIRRVISAALQQQ